MYVLGDSFNWPSWVQYQNEKGLMRQLETLLDEGYRRTAAFAFFNFGFVLVCRQLRLC